MRKQYDFAEAKKNPYSRPRSERLEPRKPGGWEGRGRISEDFDAPLPPEIQAAFEGGGPRDPLLKGQD